MGSASGSVVVPSVEVGIGLQTLRVYGEKIERTSLISFGEY